MKTIYPKSPPKNFNEFNKQLSMHRQENPVLKSRTKETILSEIERLEVLYKEAGEADPRDTVLNYNTKQLSTALRISPNDYGHFLDAVQMYKRQ